jgi:predicted nucleic-acid-binding Zn-ribbon protein
MDQGSNQCAYSTQDSFDISDGRNRYKPCPKCASEFGMGLISKGGKWASGVGLVEKGTIAVQCTICGFRGPEVVNNTNGASDRAAFDAWNGLPREFDELSEYQRANW